MNPIAIAVSCAATLGVSWCLTGVVRRYALAKGVIDVPNNRSSHVHPTPRGGGSAIVVTVLAGLAALGVAELLPARFVIGSAGAGALVAAIGFADDHRYVPKYWRLAAHFAAASIILLTLNRVPSIAILGMQLNWWFCVAALLVGIVWMINLTNFMDGIDGIAATEGITAALGAAMIYAADGAPVDLWAPPLLVASAAAGFLIWNWAPARIFMGDVGSGFLGMMLAALAVQSATIDGRLLWAWLILLGAFVVDASLTIGRRMLRWEPFHEPHRMHAYQHAARAHRSHARVTIAVAIINLVWLLPLAWMAASGRLPGIAAFAVAYAPLVYAAWQLGAGNPHPGPAIAEPDRGNIT